MTVVKRHHILLLLLLLLLLPEQRESWSFLTVYITWRKVDDGFADNDYGDDDEDRDDRPMTVYDDDDQQFETSAPLPINI